MGRYALYGSSKDSKTESAKASSILTNTAFDMYEYKSVFKNRVEPWPDTYGLDSNSKASTIPDNVYMTYEGVEFGKQLERLKNKYETSIEHINDQLHKTLNTYEEGAQSTFSKYTKYYNRFKLPTLNDAFQKGFAHVFFIRPDCNILSGSGSNLNLNESFLNDPEFYYMWKNNPDLIKQLSIDNGQTHDFMLSLSNKAASFSLSDEFINTEIYGKSFKGWQVAYGRNNVESKTAGDFSITFNDDRTLHVYQLHRLWVDYISEVYQGRKAPKSKYIQNHILDYASACYYLITAEDGETIVFWSKYYGVFPTTIPSNQYSWAQGNIIEKPQLDIKYQYSFKEDMNPEALVEFNINAGVSNKKMTYDPTFDPALGHVGATWVGAPYIELVTNDTDPECPYTFKLRFRSA